MSEDENNSELHEWIEPELEARVVALVLGEASPFESAELERLMEEKPELAIFRRRIEAVHGLVGESLHPDGEKLKLSAERREKLLATIGGDAVSDGKEVPFRKRRRALSFREWFYTIAASIVILGFVVSIGLPAASRARERAQATTVLHDARLLDASVDQYSGVAYAPRAEFADYESPADQIQADLPQSPVAATSALASSSSSSVSVPSAAEVYLNRERDLRLGIRTDGSQAGAAGRRPASEAPKPAAPEPVTTEQLADTAVQLQMGQVAAAGPEEHARLNMKLADQSQRLQTDDESSKLDLSTSSAQPIGGNPFEGTVSDGDSAGVGGSLNSPAEGKMAQLKDVGADRTLQRNKGQTTLTTEEKELVAQVEELESKIAAAEGEKRMPSPDAGESVVITASINDLKKRLAGAEAEKQLLVQPMDELRAELRPMNEASRQMRVLPNETAASSRDDSNSVAGLAGGGAATSSMTRAYNYRGVTIQGGQASDGIVSSDSFMGDAPVSGEVAQRESAARIDEKPARGGFVVSPHSPYSGNVDVRGYPPGMEVRDPYSGKVFTVPGDKTAGESTGQRVAGERTGEDARIESVPQLQISDPATQQILPMYKQAEAEKARLLNSGLSPKDARVAALQAQMDVFARQLIERGPSNRETDTRTEKRNVDDKTQIAQKSEKAKSSDSVAAKQKLADERPAPKKEVVTPAEVDAKQQPFSTFSLHVSDVSFKLAAEALRKGTVPDAATVREEEFYNAFDYKDPSPAVGEEVSCRIEQCAHPSLQQRNLVRIAVKVGSIGRSAGQPLRLTILLDTSGSMEREDREPSVQQALKALASLLGPNDRVTLIGFARQPRLLVEQLPGNQAAKLASIAAHTPSEGGTNLEEALKLAMEMAQKQYTTNAQNRVVLLTDGAANLGDAKAENLAAQVQKLRDRKIAFDACGVGAEGLNDEILEALTRKGDGRYYFLNRPEDADGGFARQLAGAFRPAAENVKLQVRFNSERVGRYKLLGFEQHRLKKEDFRNDKVDAAELAAEEAAVAVYQVEPLPEGEGELGEVFVRFRKPGSAEMVERSWTMSYDPNAPAFDQATPSMQLAGTAALIAQKLRGGDYAKLVDLETLATVVNELRAAFPENAQVGELIDMFQQVRKISGE